MSVSAYTRYKLRSVLLIVSVCAAAGTLYELVADDGITLMGPLVGMLLGFLPAIFEVLVPRKTTSRWPFAVVVLLKALLYVGLITLVIAVTSFLYSLALGLPSSYFLEAMQGRALTGMMSTFLLYLIIIFFWQLNRLLGPGVLLRYLTGGYYHPRREERIFMFLDLQGSTALAERLDYETYYALLNDFFHDLSAPALATSAQIYQYVGDEVVLTWKMKEGLRDANCIKVFFEIDDVLRRRSDYYLERYGLVPAYKAGVHCGAVISAEIGDLKRDLVYNGDVLNTTSRIESVCNQFQARLLVSAALMQQLTLPDGIEAEALGAVMLRGKQKPLALFRLHREVLYLERCHLLSTGSGEYLHAHRFAVYASD